MLHPEQLDYDYHARAAIPDHLQFFVRWRADSLAVHDTQRLPGRRQ